MPYICIIPGIDPLAQPFFNNDRTGDGITAAIRIEAESPQRAG